ncbi:hypothetical protein [Bythopirellula goksoeyrii]|uniref:Uncharacterized protein n=1 Tax=Bythopirellula goksoeyrii TaxID=1400387 RepID=A0A5B9QPS7_9BACT|nr:hypothetical protein [Bythopirellula goksoeyrii]QEG35973.1 hypothetical protein Pr1d_32820 [Bythopirellula goksoeyrii]
MIQQTSTQPLDAASLPGPDTTMKREALLSPDPRLQAMLAEAVRVGWPAAFENDLYQHDLSILEAHPDELMVWILREHGTHLFAMECESAGQATYARAVIRYWSGEDKLNVILSPAERPKFYLVSSGGLAETTAQEAASKIRSTPDTPSREDHA